MAAIAATDPAQIDLEALNREFAPLSFEERLERLYHYFPEEAVLMTSSFGTSSVLLLYLISQIRPTQEVMFIDTTYHFAETVAYKQQLTERFNLRVTDILPDEQRNRLTRETRMWETQPNRCCHYNKVLPLRSVRAGRRVWISGLMAYQTEHRSQLDIFTLSDGIIKFQPLIDMTEGEFLYYSGLYRLPVHPLEALGYGSIGCTHCTVRGDGRNGRWQGTSKEECGLHL